MCNGFASKHNPLLQHSSSLRPSRKAYYPEAPLCIKHEVKLMLGAEEATKNQLSADVFMNMSMRLFEKHL